MQKITIIGRLGRDASLRETSEGKKLLSFTVAVNGRYRGIEKTSWYDVLTFNYERYKNMAQHLTKGTSVAVVGEFDCDLEEGTDGVKRLRRTVIADSIDFVSSGVSGNTSEEATTASPSKKAPEPEMDENIPMTSKKSAPKAKAKEEVPEKPIEETATQKASYDADTDDLPF